jgi:ABC-type transport system involved in cytochrome c biogenesis permease component
MSAFAQHFIVSLKLHLRNRMALIYGFIFPTIFLVAFWVLYRFEQVPLVRHMGELLTVTALGGACFGLPTTMVSERERGVWRRYRLAPVATATLVAGTIAARYVLLVAAAIVQLGLAMALGMPWPAHALELVVAFTLVSFAFIGLGLVIAMMADTVPAVQALGQCIFLPMLIIGGVAVPLATLPEWAQRLSSFFPGRYAVEAIHACVMGSGLLSTRFAAAALVLIGGAGLLASVMMFRWDAQQRFASMRGKSWVAVALAAWIAVGLSAESTGRRRRVTPQPAAAVAAPPPTTAPAAGDPAATAPAPVMPLPAPPVREPSRTEPPPQKPSTPTPVPSLPPAAVAPPANTATAPPTSPPRTLSQPGPQPGSPPAAPLPVPPPAGEAKHASWRDVTMADVDRDLIFTRLPPDEGVVTPIARLDEEPDPPIQAQLDKLQSALPSWAPGQVKDPVQRVRNLLYVAAVPDVFQMTDLEKFIPLVVYDHIQAEIPRDDLIKVLYWIALHPYEGDDSAVDQLRPLGLNNGPADMETTRDRLSVYAVKLLGRIAGKIKPE